MAVTRYDCVTRSYEDADYGEMESAEDGAYVTSDDFDKLAKSHAGLLAEVKRLMTIPVVRDRQMERVTPVIEHAERML